MDQTKGYQTKRNGTEYAAHNSTNGIFTPADRGPFSYFGTIGRPILALFRYEDRPVVFSVRVLSVVLGGSLGGSLVVMYVLGEWWWWFSSMFLVDVVFVSGGSGIVPLCVCSFALLLTLSELILYLLPA